jgi:hypothetical protein
VSFRDTINGWKVSGCIIRFKDGQSVTVVRDHTEWLEKLGNGTSWSRPAFGVVVHRFPPEGIALPDNKQEFIGNENRV